jgi:hypothetical protein
MNEAKFPNPNDNFNFDERTRLDQSPGSDPVQKSYFGQVLVDLPDRVRVPVRFSDPAHLAHDLEANFKAGKHCIVEPALIVVPQVTAKNMIVAVTELYQSGYFTNLNPL